MKPGAPKLLVVDDEPHILEALQRGLRRSFDVRIATSGAEGLTLLAAEPDIAIVMSDMRMAIMTGAAFLAKARALAPDTVRVLLTGQAEMEDAIAAINEGNIFRFLRKPCPPELMQSTLAAAFEQYRLVTAQRELLEQTLRGAIQALCDALALANPGVFGIAKRVKRSATAIAAKLEWKDVWQLEVAAMVCQLGAMTLPAGVFERGARGDVLTKEERAMLERVPLVTDQLLAPIPRLEEVREIIRQARESFAQLDRTTGAVRPALEVPLGARILKVALDFEELEASAREGAGRALERMRARTNAYDPEVLRALESLHETKVSIVQVTIGALRPGMVIAADILTTGGQLLIARGHEVTPGLVGRLDNFVGSLASNMVSVETDAA